MSPADIEAAASRGSIMILSERIEQVVKHGYLPEQDLAYDQAELALAALAYLETAIDIALKPELVRAEGDFPESWPWQRSTWREPTDRLKALAKAGALICAEIDREMLAREIIGNPVPQTKLEIVAAKLAGGCRVCGCTDDRACTTDRTGAPIKPCHWVETDLCSACVDADRQPA